MDSFPPFRGDGLNNIPHLFQMEHHILKQAKVTFLQV